VQDIVENLVPEDDGDEEDSADNENRNVVNVET
jgi:hypothetical protein